MDLKDWQMHPDQEVKLSVENAKFAFDQAEKLLKEEMEISDQVVSRSYNLIALVSGLVSVFAGYCINSLDKMDDLFLCSSIGFVYSLFILYHLYKSVKGMAYDGIGSLPSELINDKFFLPYYDKDDRFRQRDFYIDEITSYQNRILKNRKQNEQRWDNFNDAIRYIIFMPIGLIVLYLIIAILSVGYHS